MWHCLRRAWLLYHGPTCPNGWRQLGDHCYIATPKKYFSPHVVAKDLDKIQFSASANAGGNDQISFRSSDGKLHALTAPDSTAELAQGWTRAEFNIYGAANGSKANFNTNSSLDVKVEAPGATGTVSCNRHNTSTGESTNLYAAGECTEVQNTAHPTFTFNQNNQ